MDLGVYVFAKNEENLIVPCVSALQKVFPQVEVIDLGSKDTTLEKLSSLNCKVRNVTCTPEMYPYLKTSVGKEHNWAFFVDGDEIYPEEQLKKIEPTIKTLQYRGYRIAWRYVKEENGKKFVAKNLVSNVIKIYRSDRFTWTEPWPFEVMKNRKSERMQPKEQQDIWCWHARLLNRSRYKDPIREIKKEDFPYNIKWEKVTHFEWEV